MSELLLGVNVDHIATLREARGTNYPDPVYAASVAEHAGADGITVHLREDRRHIQDRDIYVLKQTLHTRMNFEMAVTDEMLAIACEVKPVFCCLVPEKREELTTEGGLDVVGNFDKISRAVSQLTAAGIETSLFIDADKSQIDAAIASKAPYIEIHTGHYADAKNEQDQKIELIRLIEGIKYAHANGLKVNAGHGLNYFNVKPIAAIEEIIELNIGHAIIARAVIDGLDKAIRDMKQLMREARS
ncbi:MULTISPECIES: pyridoxine 5'-phosphate synthase [unclassified Colwellia]|jgi:pyridoxine 5-phosphate synthase|uniref:pyridoxine 5'-phosphate synthase n=1 Tax=unclassified Colwellia TaxID=196834 RepID=UPI0015F38664|nr:MULTISPECIES: pyridoxine 5'-phosphate synthase [unclassified Colwellia]MBA6362354.1 pyridoxine 5'-phosphate synthase [Colwellia sp. BRX8-8]MBA6335844.1 pyridoxine 5'-phosphate synthase [Colwellia sp. BRX8-7]MBA6354398.1 pyridoxine 5'-phosphate synthase [Colwellia sp. BRX8-3]MBA6358335.1 pyridoxine 5'-phosphate synthase [Colwellia sp. BRX8-6]MBA6365912.1 pyridoxine 5'-phosphate synthase [Colwellia sp. BRX8-5]|tara:strand:- start:242 stop:973 length:732 start_codon:yes stop_codon:yes gene_type:complete